MSSYNYSLGGIRFSSEGLKNIERRFQAEIISANPAVEENPAARIVLNDFEPFTHLEHYAKTVDSDVSRYLLVRLGVPAAILYQSSSGSLLLVNMI
jgi:hypothetical protein